MTTSVVSASPDLKSQYGILDVTFTLQTATDSQGITFISYGVPEKGDAHWLDYEGSFIATVDASRVFTLLGAKGLEVEGDYYTAKMPPMNEGSLAGWHGANMMAATRTHPT